MRAKLCGQFLIDQAESFWHCTYIGSNSLRPNPDRKRQGQRIIRTRICCHLYEARSQLNVILLGWFRDVKNQAV